MAINSDDFVSLFRGSAPYVHAHRGRCFVVAFDGEAVASPGFAGLVHDLALISALGVRLVVVAGSRPQIDRRLAAQGIEPAISDGLRVTDDAAMQVVKEAVGVVRAEIEALFTTGLMNSPMAGAEVRVVGGNFVTAKPRGVLNGVDFLHTGKVRRVDVEAVQQQLAAENIVLLTCLGCSVTGEALNLRFDEVAAETAIAIGADKLVFLSEQELPHIESNLSEKLNLEEAEQTDAVPMAALRAAKGGVPRVHLIRREDDGGLLRELYTRDGIGTLITGARYESLRQAQAGDIGGILAVIGPLEASGVLVPRSREQIELTIKQFSVIERDGMVIGCAALQPFEPAAVGELACVAVHPDYRDRDLGETLLAEIEASARSNGLQALFVLTTEAEHWFREQGFEPAELTELPVERQQIYNYQRNAKIFLKQL